MAPCVSVQGLALSASYGATSATRRLPADVLEWLDDAVHDSPDVLLNLGLSYLGDANAVAADAEGDMNTVDGIDAVAVAVAAA